MSKGGERQGGHEHIVLGSPELVFSHTVADELRPVGRRGLASQELAEVVLGASGRFYYAKDAILTASSHERIYGREAVFRFASLKQRLDPKFLLQTDLSRRVCGE